MKTKSVLIIMIILAILVIGVFAYSVSNSSTYVSSVTLSNIITTPQTLHSGSPFSINVTVHNDEPYEITIGTDSISAKFDKNVSVSHYMGCSPVFENKVLMPSQSMEMKLPYGCDNYIANSNGTANVVVQLGYVSQKMEHVINASKELVIVSSSMSLSP